MVAFEGIHPLHPTPKGLSQIVPSKSYLTVSLSSTPNPTAATQIDVRYWHLADMQIALKNVRFEGNNGHDADVMRCQLMTQSGHSMARSYALLSTGWLPALCGKKTMQPVMIAAMTADAIGRLKASPP